MTTFKLSPQVSTECQHYRESRIGIDKVEDEVEISLVKEVDCIREYQQRMKLLIELIIKQLDSNLSAQKQLNTDIRNKVIELHNCHTIQYLLIIENIRED